jgi:hypothetical protein
MTGKRAMVLPCYRVTVLPCYHFVEAYNESSKKSRSNYSENEMNSPLDGTIEILAIKIISGMILNG